jgi:hypothetical protein
MPSSIPKPWDAFLTELDAALSESVELHCIGGFVVALLHGINRPTADVDVLEIRPRAVKATLHCLAGRHSALHRKHGVYLQEVTVLGAYPDDYETRLIEMFPGAFQRLRLLALDPYDLALTKLERNSSRDREDVSHLAKSVSFDLDVLRKRYEDEMQPYVSVKAREDATLRFWIEMIEEQRRAITADNQRTPEENR